MYVCTGGTGRNGKRICLDVIELFEIDVTLISFN